jgi:predicted Zn-dependent protease
VLKANGTYHYGKDNTLVTLSLHKHHLSILLGDGKEVLWYYDQIMKLDSMQFSYPGHEQQILNIHTLSFADALTGHMQQQSGTLRRQRGSTLLKVLIAFLVLCILFYFLALPRIAAGMADKISPEYEQRLGEQMYQSMKGSFQIDERRTAYLNTFFQEMHFTSSYPIKITVVKSDVANAFAMPGGHIVIYDKILEGMPSHEALAALLAHEFTHIEKRHSLRGMFRQLSSQLFFTLLLGDIDIAGGILLRNADNLKQLSYSRSLETEADENGSHLLTQQGMNCNGFVQLFQLLREETGKVKNYEWLNSHPDLENRIEHIKNLPHCNGSSSIKLSLKSIFDQIKTIKE